MGQHSADPHQPSAVERYKETIAMVGESVERMRARDRAVVRQLLERLAESQERMAAALEQEKAVKADVEQYWEAAVKALWDERWTSIGSRPTPDEAVPPRPQQEYNAAMDAAFHALEEALQKRSLLRRKP
ncbi:hypothetical protein [Saccharothrix coeruleofusca]|uniref:Uncharacterized protein n=1 Tax=Saccharothrix coeruleofusca TaxID=33919 RepID=A0A918AGR4_9PSEU|nr:hypothetical protein [Saccharothrix coeruleofusca]MBP2340595.1 hypothetical protein [Saccharothrix coeruleofusca]GGP34404.1 hypothetical protein GCM10010185_01250 [Saccharothrix coeruleofusca]